MALAADRMQMAEIELGPLSDRLDDDEMKALHKLVEQAAPAWRPSTIAHDTIANACRGRLTEFSTASGGRHGPTSFCRWSSTAALQWRPAACPVPRDALSIVRRSRPKEIEDSISRRDGATRRSPTAGGRRTPPQKECRPHVVRFERSEIRSWGPRQRLGDGMRGAIVDGRKRAPACSPICGAPSSRHVKAIREGTSSISASAYVPQPSHPSRSVI